MPSNKQKYERKCYECTISIDNLLLVYVYTVVNVCWFAAVTATIVMSWGIEFIVGNKQCLKRGTQRKGAFGYRIECICLCVCVCVYVYYYNYVRLCL